MRNISFQLTTEQVKNRSKTVTRRLGWKNLKAGELLQACEKCMGLGKGGKINRLAVIRVVSVRREQLKSMLPTKTAGSAGYGMLEALKEGFPNLGGKGFVAMFCEHMKCKPRTKVTRIEFEYV